LQFHHHFQGAVQLPRQFLQGDPAHPSQFAVQTRKQFNLISAIEVVVKGWMSE